MQKIQGVCGPWPHLAAHGYPLGEHERCIKTAVAEFSATHYSVDASWREFHRDPDGFFKIAEIAIAHGMALIVTFGGGVAPGEFGEFDALIADDRLRSKNKIEPEYFSQIARIHQEQIDGIAGLADHFGRDISSFWIQPGREWGKGGVCDRRDEPALNDPDEPIGFWPHHVHEWLDYWSWNINPRGMKVMAPSFENESFDSLAVEIKTCQAAKGYFERFDALAVEIYDGAAAGAEPYKFGRTSAKYAKAMIQESFGYEKPIIVTEWSVPNARPNYKTDLARFEAGIASYLPNRVFNGLLLPEQWSYLSPIEVPN